MTKEEREWNYGRPPNEMPVEVEQAGSIIPVIAFYGRDGHLPHWRNEDRSICWDLSTFNRWRPLPTDEEKATKLTKPTNYPTTSLDAPGYCRVEASALFVTTACDT